ncbi:type II secretion system F family protein [Gluconacetobacter sp.]|uniref:type II secretion system F family protein n=1 Tax=Gluconacetobacter sp. TaxID=1935994 RepID=UPI0039ED078C
MTLNIVYTSSARSRPGVTANLTEWLDVHMSFRWRTRAQLYRMISVRMRQNASVDRILRMYSRQQKRRRRSSVPRLLDSVLTRMTEKGLPFAEALRPYIPDDEYMMILSGERAGDIGSAMDLVCDIKTRTGRIMRAAQSAAFQPLMYIVVLFIYLYAMAKMVIPSLLHGVPGQHAASTSQDVLVFAANLATGANAFIILGSLIATVVAVWFSLARLTGPLRVMLERMPPWSIYRNIQGYIWISSFIALVRAGMTDTDALAHQMQGASPWLAERLGAILARLGPRGMSLPEAMEDSGLAFPSPEVIDDIEASWGGKEAYGRLLESSKMWADEIELSTLAQAAAIKSLATTLMMLLAGALIVASNNIGSNMGGGQPM